MNDVRWTLCVPQFCALWIVVSAAAYGQWSPGGAIRAATVPTLEALIADEDTDGDKNITIDDPRFPETSRGDRRFTLQVSEQRSFEVAGTYYLQTCLQF